MRRSILFWIVLIVAMVLLALALAAGGVHAAEGAHAMTGGDPGAADLQTNVSQPITHLEIGRLQHAMRDTSDELRFPFEPEAPVQAEPATGGAEPKHWTAFRTWGTLGKDKSALGQYQRDTHKFMELDVDWTLVREELEPLLDEPREWAGLINFESPDSNRLKVVYKEPSPVAVGESAAPQTAAEVPGELVDKIMRRPALIFFHTHPGDAGHSAIASPIDMLGCFEIAETGKYAAEAVISKFGVAIYAPNVNLRRAIWGDGKLQQLSDRRRRGQKLRANRIRHQADMIAALNGIRSWVPVEWTYQQYVDIAHQYGISYYMFPNDKFAQILNTMKFTAPMRLDHSQQIALMDLAEIAAREAAGSRRRVHFDDD